MRIRCPHCGERDGREFGYLGDAALRERPDGLEADAAAMAGHVYLRGNPAGPHRELWYHGPCRTWLEVERDTRSHAVLAVAFPGGGSAS